MKQLWKDKYRPKTVSEYAFSDENLKAQVEYWIKNGSIPHLLLSGRAGTGKTTLARVLINELGIDEFDVMDANGSKEARKVDWVDKLISFCQTMPYGEFKVVLIDEADFMNPNSVQPALRALMEDYSESVRFILTCNYPNKILPAIHSRCTNIHIDKPDITEFTARAATVLVTENVEFDLDTLDLFVKAIYPDLRKCLNLMQENSITGVLVEPSSSGQSSQDWRFQAVDLFKKGRILDARTAICSQAGIEDIDSMYRWMYDNLELWSKEPEKQDQAIVIIRNAIANVPLMSDQEINLAACLIELGHLSQ